MSLEQLGKALRVFAEPRRIDRGVLDERDGALAASPAALSRPSPAFRSSRKRVRSALVSARSTA